MCHVTDTSLDRLYIEIDTRSLRSIIAVYTCAHVYIYIYLFGTCDVSLAHRDEVNAMAVHHEAVARGKAFRHSRQLLSTYIYTSARYMLYLGADEHKHIFYILRKAKENQVRDLCH